MFPRHGHHWCSFQVRDLETEQKQFNIITMLTDHCVAYTPISDHLISRIGWDLLGDLYIMYVGFRETWCMKIFSQTQGYYVTSQTKIYRKSPLKENFIQFFQAFFFLLLLATFVFPVSSRELRWNCDYQICKEISGVSGWSSRMTNNSVFSFSKTPHWLSTLRTTKWGLDFSSKALWELIWSA